MHRASRSTPKSPAKILSHAHARARFVWAAVAIRLVVPTGPGTAELGQLVDAYNRAHPGVQVQLLRRGEHFSSLKNLIASYLAGDAPELAAVETSELPALERSQLAKRTIPFQRSVPIVVVDSGATDRVPTTWDELTRLARQIATRKPAPQTPPLAIPLQGARGLWILEAVAAKPLWTREEGGLKANRELGPAIQALQQLLSPQTPELAASELSWERATQDFIDRRSPLLVTTLDALPLIRQKAAFRWRAGILPARGPAPGPAPGQAQPPVLPSGSELVITRDSQAVRDFVQYLQAPAQAARWSSGYLPPAQAPLPSTEPERAIAQAVRAVKGKRLRTRSTDTDVVRAHTEWIAALHLLFGEPAKRLPVETVMTQLDTRLSLTSAAN